MYACHILVERIVMKYLINMIEKDLLKEYIRRDFYNLIRILAKKNGGDKYVNKK